MNKFPNPIDHCYILCDPIREPKRAKYLNDWITSNNIDNSVITMGLKCYGSDLSAEEIFRVYNPWVSRKPVELDRNFNSYNLKPGEISLVINWADAAKKAIDAKYEAVMILESDVVFNDNFLNSLGLALDAIKNVPWDYLSISDGANLRPLRKPDQTNPGWFPSLHPYFHTRTTDAMIVKVSMLSKIYSTLFPFAEVLDWELNYQLSLHKSFTLWLDPPLVKGTSTAFTTTI